MVSDGKSAIDKDLLHMSGCSLDAFKISGFGLQQCDYNVSVCESFLFSHSWSLLSFLHVSVNVSNLILDLFKPLFLQ